MLTIWQWVGVSVLLFSGKGLGGSSGINFLMWTRPQREEIDGQRVPPIRPSRVVLIPNENAMNSY